MHVSGASLDALVCFNLVIERLLISGFQQVGAGQFQARSFNLVIERLLISGERGLPLNPPAT